MVRDSFYIKKNRLDELKLFIRDNLESARFANNPIEFSNQYYIILDLNVADSNKLNELFNKWYCEDNKPLSKGKSFWKRIFN